MESPLAVAMPTTPTPTPAAVAAAVAAKAAATPTTTISAATTTTAVAVTTPRLDSPLGNGGELFNIAKAKKVELQNLSSRFQAAVSQTNSATSAVAAEAGAGALAAGELLVSLCWTGSRIYLLISHSWREQVGPITNALGTGRVVQPRREGRERGEGGG